MIIVIGGFKGGTGKTTIATNLTQIRSKSKKVLLIDADEQKSATDWVNQREVKTNWTTIQLSGKNIYLQLQKLKEDYDDIIIDVGGRDTTSQRSCLVMANKFILPFRPRSMDIWTIGHVSNLISEIKSVNTHLECYALLNQCDHIGKDNDEAKQILSKCSEMQCLKQTIGNRKAFPDAAALGLSVNEIPVCKASIEMKTVYNEIFYRYTKDI